MQASILVLVALFSVLCFATAGSVQEFVIVSASPAKYSYIPSPVLPEKAEEYCSTHAGACELWQ